MDRIKRCEGEKVSSIALFMVILALILRFSCMKKPLSKSLVDVSAFILILAFLRSILTSILETRSMGGYLYHALLLVAFIYIWRYILRYKPHSDVKDGRETASLFVKDFRADLNEVIEKNLKHPMGGKLSEKIKEKTHPVSAEKSHLKGKYEAYGSKEINEATYSKEITDSKGYVKNYKKHHKDALPSLAMNLALFILFIGAVLALYAYMDPSGCSGLLQSIVPPRWR